MTLGTRLSCSQFPNGYEAISYGRGTWLFHMLRSMMRDAERSSGAVRVPMARLASRMSLSFACSQTNQGALSGKTHCDPRVVAGLRGGVAAVAVVRAPQIPGLVLRGMGERDGNSTF